MKKLFNPLLAAFVVVFMLGCEKAPAADTATETASTAKTEKAAPAPAAKNTKNSVQVFTADNSDGKITAKTIEAAFDSVGLTIGANNDMNSPFSQRFPKLHYKVYHLAVFQNNDLTFSLVKKYANFGALTPLTMSIWSDGDTMNISTLTLFGMSRAGEIPMDDADLIAYADLVKKALKTAMPNGSFKALPYEDTRPTESLATNFEVEIDTEEITDFTEYKEDFQAEFEAEMEPIGFLFPNYINLTEEIFEEKGYDGFDFYDTYSICKFDVIYPVSKDHPEAGAWAPCSFYMYKKKGENVMKMGFLSVDNWISSTNMTDKESIDPLREAQGMIETIITEMTE
jgi:uncharacterized protein (DUF302 family)